jgi:hypothetical protein
MLLAQGGVENLQSVEPIVIILAITSILFWRVVVKILAVAAVVIFISGVILLLQVASHAAR